LKGKLAMSKLTAALALLAACGIAARGADETTTVEIYCAAEHVPTGLKEGARVNLIMVVGKTATPTGKVS
jgi:outer membrane lipopolysaccharide assembly protein LptE/RlpB